MIELSAIQIPAEHPSYPGHFPAMPILPGVVILDEALYAIAAACKLDLAHCQIASAKFHGVMRPGDALRLEHESLPNGSIRFTIRTQGRSVATGMLLTRSAQFEDVNAV